MEITTLVRDPEIHSGDVVFLGTRVPVSTLLEFLRDGATLQEFLGAYPSVTREQALLAFSEIDALVTAGAPVVPTASAHRVSQGASHGRRT
jgi:uncharacterized protein (DUF433 family)